MIDDSNMLTGDDLRKIGSQKVGYTPKTLEQALSLKSIDGIIYWLKNNKPTGDQLIDVGLFAKQAKSNKLDLFLKSFKHEAAPRIERLNQAVKATHS